MLIFTASCKITRDINRRSGEEQCQNALTSLHFHFSLYTVSSSKLEEIGSSIFISLRSAFKIKASKVLLVGEFFSIQILKHFFLPDYYILSSL